MNRIGILGAAEIAHRMFVPALNQSPDFVCVGVAAGAFDPPDKKLRFRESYNLEVFDEPDSFLHLIERPDVDALYIPQPPALHFEWAKLALQHGKHVFLEKPSTDQGGRTRELVALAKEKKLVLQENYMFQYHAQLSAIRHMLDEDTVGDLRLVRGTFGFPLRAQNDFRYNKTLGGGALLDAGGYVVKLAALLLGQDLWLNSASMGFMDGFDVDMFGSVSFTNPDGLVFQGAYGMDCHYQCALELWGSKGKLTAPRIFTAPPGFSPIILLETAEGKQEIPLPSDDHFLASLLTFSRAFEDTALKNKMYDDMILQTNLIDQIRARALGDLL